MRQVELADDDFYIHAEIVFVAENLDHAAARILGGRGPVGDLDIHHYIFQIVPDWRAARLRCPALDLDWFFFARSCAGCCRFRSLRVLPLGISIPGGITISCVIF